MLVIQYQSFGCGDIFMQRILITGGSGLLGTHIIKLKPAGTDIVATYNSEFAIKPRGAEWRKVDLKNQEGVQKLIADSAPDVIIHAGSIGSVDFADKNRETSHQINVQGTQAILDAAKAIGAKVIFVSSNAVFDGNNPPYKEDDPVCPVNYYGELKVEGERLTLAADPGNAVVRPILMYGWPNEGRRGNLVTFWLSKLEAGEDILAVNDVWSKPLWIDDAAKVCWEVIAQNATGIFNVCGSERVTLYDLAAKTAEVFGFEPDRVKAVPSSHFGDIAQRPKDTSFDISKIVKELGVTPLNIHDGLVRLRETRSE